MEMAAHQAPGLDKFSRQLAEPGLVERLRAGLIGDGAMIEGPFGARPLVYADYVASGRALAQVEDFIRDEVLPYYANSHTEDSYCGGYMTRLRAEARAAIARIVGAGDDCEVIFTGSGATAGLNRLVFLLGVADAAGRGERPVVIVGPYEHHSNILPWRESGAEIIEIPEDANGGPQFEALETALCKTVGRLRLCTFSAASNVTGIISDIARVSALARQHRALCVWDYACGGPYLPISMSPAPGVGIDAVVVSPHKFVGGPGASGILVVRKSAVAVNRPTWPGGGTVSFVSPWAHDYHRSLAVREEAGTPNVIGDIRAALAFIVKQSVGTEFIAERGEAFNRRALAAWSKNPRLILLGADKSPRLPIFSFRVTDGRGGHIRYRELTRMLSDHFGIQARGGCSCAGPYGHRLLGIGEELSEVLRTSIRNGHDVEKPGWIRLNFSYLLTDAKADMIIRSVDELAAHAPDFQARYAEHWTGEGVRPKTEAGAAPT